MNKTILIIENEPLIQDIYRFLFMKKGFDVLIASDGESGLELASKTSVDAILLNTVLPKLNGFKVLRELRDKSATTRNVPVFLFSNLNREEISKKGITLNLQDYLVDSNLLPKQVVSKVETFLGGSKSR